MSLQWTLIASFLYVEVAIVLLLVLPVASPTRWQKLFKSRFLQSLNNQASIYFVVLLGVLVLFLMDAIREMRKYSTSLDHTEHHHQLNVEMQGGLHNMFCALSFHSGSWLRRKLCLISNSLRFYTRSRKYEIVSRAEEFIHIWLRVVSELGDTPSCHPDIHPSHLTRAKRGGHAAGTVCDDHG